MLRASPVRRPFSRRSLFFAAALFLCLLPVCAAAQSQDSQDVAEAARQEKARKATAAKKDSHVYTNEDLKRPEILTPEDRVQAEARKKNETIPPTGQPAESLDAAAPAPKTSESLGEVARRYRHEKNAREAEQALKNPPHIALPSDLSQPALASPRPNRPQPLTPLVPAAKPARPLIAPPPGRRDPFSRPTQVLAPKHPSQISPTLPAPSQMTNKSLTLTRPAAIAPRATPPRAPLAVEPRPAAPSVPVPSPTRPQPKAEPIAPTASASRITVQPGDSLWKLARLHLGRGARWHDFLAVNPNLPSPEVLQPGDSLIVPVHNAAHSHPETKSTQQGTLKVQLGDSLWKIAAAHFGSGTVWPCLSQANPQLRDANVIYPGQTLTLPAACSRP